ncbi:hypothetical protein [Rheinheimera aquimaris]|uniref:hypothetical protein n=1 Tax=Rheinheimera aquimaris TaxID=412437 RepID=UPI001E65DC52|nr:hypothetical protein [Rheinheimera aquimaris]MCD1598214.1 hypothetical protein [Rheinheimera aquimaris]
MTAYYKGLVFKTKLVAQWAAFFDLAKWNWWPNPKSVGDWQPDFLVTFPCGHSECSGKHTLLISVLSVSNLNEVKGHPCFDHHWQVVDETGNWLADAGALFGNNPAVTTWEMGHGSGGGVEQVEDWVPEYNAQELWIKAKELIS